MGEVYLAEDTRLDRKVAIKFLNEEFSKDADKLNPLKLKTANTSDDKATGSYCLFLK